MLEKNKSKIIAYCYIILLYLLVFQNFLQSFIGIFQYLDETIALVGFLALIYDTIRKRGKVDKKNFIILVCLLFIFIIGMYAVIKNKYQTITYALLDAVLLFKFFLVYFLGQIVTKNNNIINYSNKIYLNLKIIVVILAIFTIVNYVFKIYPFGERYGIMVNKLFFEHPTYLAAACMALIVNIMAFSKRFNNIYVCIALMILASTLRAKAIAGAVVVIIIAIYVNKTKRKISMLRMSIIGIIAIIVAFPQIKYYFFDIEGSARRVLTETSIKIANDNFPIGTGFGTFASYASGENYSGVYEAYGISDVQGLEKEKANFVSDTFWPLIIGEFGYLGTILYLICLLIIFIRMQKSFKKENSKIYIAKFSALAYLLISSIAEPSFVNPISIPLALILGMEINGEREEKE